MYIIFDLRGTPRQKGISLLAVCFLLSFVFSLYDLIANGRLICGLFNPFTSC